MFLIARFLLETSTKSCHIQKPNYFYKLKLGETAFMNDVRNMDKSLKRNFNNPPIKDTVSF